LDYRLYRLTYISEIPNRLVLLLYGYEEILRKAPSKDSEVDQLIRNEVRDLILKIITMSSIEQEYSDKTGRLAPDYKAFMILRGDKKFFGVLREIQGDFDKGCKRFGL
jgi:hypothetical protein